MKTTEVPKTRETVLDDRLETMRRAWEVKDSTRLLSLFSEHPDVVNFGSDLWEKSLGPAAVADEFPGWIASCPPWVTMTVRSRVKHINGDVAWTADEYEGSWTQGTESGSLIYRMTTIWEWDGNTWKLFHANASIPD